MPKRRRYSVVDDMFGDPLAHGDDLDEMLLIAVEHGASVYDWETGLIHDPPDGVQPQ